jgi:Tfp pilus assembly protein PilX
MHKNQERGIAIVLALILMSAMSVLAASLMFLSQTETYASMNYRMMSQARYAGEAAVQKASDFLLDGTQYTIPNPGSVIDPLSNYDRTKSPVVCVSGCPNSDPNNPNHYVILSAASTQPYNYPAASVQTAFNTAAQGMLAAGNASLNYGAYATLLSMQLFDSYGGTQNVILTWQITGVGSLAGPRPANVEVVAVVEQNKVPSNNFAAFATANTCGAITFVGNVSTDSYDSRVAGGFAASQDSSGGDVGTNGNLSISGHVAVQGNLSSPKAGVGVCTEGAVVALTEGGSASVSGSVLKLPQAVVYPPPVFSVTPPTTTVTLDGTTMTAAQAATTCSSLSPALVVGVTCVIDPVAQSLTLSSAIGVDITLPSVSVAGGYKLVIAGTAPAQNVNINSLTGSGAVEINANLASNLNQSVVLKIAGKNPDGTDMTTPFDLSTMSWKQNSASNSLNAAALQIVYGGTALISMTGGNSQSAVTIYAPNAAFQLQGTQDLYGSVLAKTIYSNGTPAIHYDRRLQDAFMVAGQAMVGTFSWKRY